MINELEKNRVGLGIVDMSIATETLQRVYSKICASVTDELKYELDDDDDDHD